MPTSLSRVQAHLRALFAFQEPEKLQALLLPTEEEVSPSLSSTSSIREDHVENRWALLDRISEGNTSAIKKELLDDRTRDRMDVYSGNIENFVGTTEVPIGIAGPLRIRGLYARGDYYIPLATTEAALVASYSRGVQAISASGGCVALLAAEGVSRAPAFWFEDLVDAGKFIVWLSEQGDELKKVAESTTRHGKLLDIGIHIEGNHVYLHLDYSTGEAAGQNMVTIATQAVCEAIEATSPVKPVEMRV